MNRPFLTCGNFVYENYSKSMFLHSDCLCTKCRRLARIIKSPWARQMSRFTFQTVFIHRKRMDDFNTNFHLDQPGGPPPPLVAPHGGPGGGMDDGSSQMPSQRQVQVIISLTNKLFWHFNPKDDYRLFLELCTCSVHATLPTWVHVSTSNCSE